MTEAILTRARVEEKPQIPDQNKSLMLNRSSANLSEIKPKSNSVVLGHVGFLNQKYGLKNLIIEWATSNINAIKMFCMRMGRFEFLARNSEMKLRRSADF